MCALRGRPPPYRHLPDVQQQARFRNGISSFGLDEIGSNGILRRCGLATLRLRFLVPSQMRCVCVCVGGKRPRSRRTRQLSLALFNTRAKSRLASMSRKGIHEFEQNQSGRCSEHQRPASEHLRRVIRHMTIPGRAPCVLRRRRRSVVKSTFRKFVVSPPLRWQDIRSSIC